MSRARSHRSSVLAFLLGVSLLAPAAAAAASPTRTLEGRLVVAHGEQYAGAGAPMRSVWYSKLVTSSGEVDLAYAGKRPAQFLNGSKVRVHGSMSGNTLTVGAGGADAQLLQGAVAAALEKKVAVLLLKFAVTDPEPYTT